MARIPEEPIDRMLFVLVHGADKLNELVPMKPWNDKVDPKLELAWELFSLPEQRAYVDACVFATEDNGAISEAFRVDEETVQYYRMCFFDTGEFRTSFAEIPFLKTLKDGTLEKHLLTMAYNEGFDTLRFHFSRDKTLVSEEEVIRSTMTDAFFRSRAHRGRPLTHKAAKESLKWAQTAITCGKLLMKEDGPTQSTGDIAFKFRDGQTTTSIHQLETEGVKVIH